MLARVLLYNFLLCGVGRIFCYISTHEERDSEQQTHRGTLYMLKYVVVRLLGAQVTFFAVAVVDVATNVAGST